MTRWAERQRALSCVFPCELRGSGLSGASAATPFPLASEASRPRTAAEGERKDAGLGAMGAVEQKFHELAERWKKERNPFAAPEAMFLHPAYQQIIGMGTAVVPLLLLELEQRPDEWFWALRAITQEDPVPEADRGRLRPMIEAWLRWGKIWEIADGYWPRIWEIADAYFRKMKIKEKELGRESETTGRPTKENMREMGRGLFRHGGRP
ncbi:MAG: hypothetical protein HYZ53_06870 [Planctomycetes bacterium]|nr:hypothetical protein [Planctomycetota bacterium]